MSFLIRRSGQDWQEPAASSYSNEAELQDLLATAPSLLPGDEALAVVREFCIPEVGSVDLVGVSSTGRVVVVECKLRANPQIRREVVGQALAYAGGLWQMPIDDFVAEFEHKAGSSFDHLLGELSNDEPADLRAEIESALASGDFRVVIAVDEITSELRSVVEYLNGHTLGLEVIAVELDYTKDGDIEILVPTTYGLETAMAKKPGKASVGKKWTLATMREALVTRATPEVVGLVERMLGHGQSNGHHFHCGSGFTPGMSCYYLINGVPVSMWALYVYEDKQLLAPSLGALLKHGEERATGYLERLKRASGLARGLADVTTQDLKKYPNLVVADLTGEDIEAWIASIDAVRDSETA